MLYYSKLFGFLCGGRVDLGSSETGRDKVQESEVGCTCYNKQRKLQGRYKTQTVDDANTENVGRVSLRFQQSFQAQQITDKI